MTNTAPQNRTITGLANAADTADLVPVNTMVRNKLLYYFTDDADTIKPQVPGYILNEGMGLWILNNKNTDNNLLISIDNINYYTVIDANGLSDTNCIKKGELEFYVFNGTAFQEIFPGFKICPGGFIEVNSEYCIQQNENSAANYWTAIEKCNDYNAKLCSWGEWYYACQKSGLGLINMNNNWEWSESATNHATAVLTYGNGSCKASSESNTQIITTLKYRCCYRKK